MKKVLVIVLALLMVLPFVSCGSKMDKIEDRLFEIAQDAEYMTIDMGQDENDDWGSEIEGEEDFEGDILRAYYVDWDDYEALIIEFEKKSDAEAAEDEVVDSGEWDNEFGRSFKCVREGNILIFGSKKLVDMIIE